MTFIAKSQKLFMDGSQIVWKHPVQHLTIMNTKIYLAPNKKYITLIILCYKEKRDPELIICVHFHKPFGGFLMRLNWKPH